MPPSGQIQSLPALFRWTRSSTEEAASDAEVNETVLEQRVWYRASQALELEAQGN